MADPTSPSSWEISNTTNPTSPTSSRHRKQGSSGESTATNVDTTDTYRQGFPAPLRPLPQEHYIATRDDGERMRWESTQEAILGFIQARNVHFESLALINRRHRRAKVSDNDLTILITAKHDPTSDSWYLMLQDIYTYLQQNGLPPIRAEIFDPLYVRVPDHFIVELSHPLISAWPNLCHRIIEALGSRPWLTLTAVRRGIHKTSTDNPITILITTPDPPAIDVTREAILLLCARAGFHLQFEISEESSVFGTSSPDEMQLHASAFTGPILMGSSVSAKSVEDTSGTMGGAIILSKNNSRVRVGVTNFHIMQTYDTDRK
jgi:hypothetical protein